MKTIQKYLITTLVTGAFLVGFLFPLDVAKATGIDPNPAPTANAGADQTLQYPTNRTTLSGSGTVGVVSYDWSRIAGAGTIVSPNSAATDITDLAVGTTTFRLTVTDSFGRTGTDDVNIVVTSFGGGGGTNGATANAGPDQTIYYPADSVNVSGSSTGINGFVIYYTWALVSGGGTISSPNSASTSITGLPLGTSTFIFTATNNTGDTATDEIDVDVLQSPPPLNIPPTAYAGSDQTIYLPTSTAYLVGNGSDSDGSIVSYSWSKISGSGTISTMTGSGAGDAVTITGLTLGDSVFRLTVTDDQGSTGTDDLTIKVLSSGGTGGGGTGGGTGGSGGGSGGGGVSYVCPVGTTGVYPNCIANTSNVNAVYFIKTAKVNIRASASVSSAKVTTVKRNTLLEVLEGNQSSAWIKVKTSSNQIGYVMSRYTQPLVKIGNKAVITQRLVNIRASESSRSRSLRTIKNTDIVDIMYVSPITSWVKVKLANGTTGFVNKFLLKAI